MTFEGQTKVLPIKGIERAGADNLCEDGSMNEVVGLEYKEGSYVPYTGGENSNTYLARCSIFRERLVVVKSGVTSIYFRYPENDTNVSKGWKRYVSAPAPEYAWTPLPSSYNHIYSDQYCVNMIDATVTEHSDEDALSKIRIHKTSVQNNIIMLSQNGKVYWMTEEDFNDDESTDDDVHQFSGITTASDIEFIGNVICISTEEEIKYFIFKNENNTFAYTLYSDNNTNQNNVSIRVVRGLYDNTTESIRYQGVGTWNPSTSSSGVSYPAKTIESELIKAIGEAKAYGGLYGYYLVSYGYRLNNGDIVNLSNPILLCPPDVAYGEYMIKDSNSSLVSLIINRIDFHKNYSTVISTASTNDKIGFDRSVFYRKETDATKTADHIPYAFGTYKKNTETPDVVINTFMTGIATNSLQIKIGNNLPINTEVNSLCIFLSEVIDPFYPIENYGTVGFGDANNYASVVYNMIIQSSTNAECWSYYPRLREAYKVIKDIKKIKNLYLVSEIKKEDFTLYNDWKSIDLTGLLGDILTTLDSMPISAFTTYKYGIASLDSYNARLHAYNFFQKTDKRIIRDMFFVPRQSLTIHPYEEYPQTGIVVGDGQVWSGYHTGNSTAIFTGKWEIDIHCKYDNGTTYTNVLSGTYGSTDYIPIIVNPYVSCIDKNAYEIVFRLIVYNHNGTVLTQTKYYTKTVSLSKNTNLGIVENISSLTPVVLTEITDPTQIPEILPVETESNTGETWHNKLIVSDVAYPSYFPKDKTYTIGNGTILKLARLSTSLSQDSFGRYPLLAFCTDGIYSLSVDTDGGAYTNITPFSREVCVNPNTICEIDGAVIFASDKGLMVATEKGVDFFNPVLNGEPKHLPMDDKSKGNGLYYYGKIISTKGAAQLWDNPTRNANGTITVYNDKAISRQDFINYLKDEDAVTGEKLTCISYVSMKNKLIVYNRTKEFIYWIDIPTRNTTKLYTHISTDNGNYPTEKYYSLCENENKEITFDYLSENVDTDTMFQTRPIKIAKGLKGTFRVVLRGYFRNDETYAVNNEDKKYYAELFVLGSLDGTNWQVIGKKEKCLHDGFHDFGCETDRVSYNYLMICFSGRLQPDKEVNGMSDDTEGSHIDSIEITFESRDDNKR